MTKCTSSLVFLMYDGFKQEMTHQKSRDSCIICKAWCKTKMWGGAFDKIHSDYQDAMGQEKTKTEIFWVKYPVRYLSTCTPWCCTDHVQTLLISHKPRKPILGGFGEWWSHCWAIFAETHGLTMNSNLLVTAFKYRPRVQMSPGNLVNDDNHC